MTQEINENTITRIFDAPRSLIFELWKDPKHLDNWYGPKGFTIESEMDFRVGGEWKYIMKSGNGSSFTSKVEYQEIVDNEKIKYLEKSAKAQLLIALSFEDEETDKTKFNLEISSTDDQFTDQMFEGAARGFNSALDKLEAYLKTM